MVKEEIVIKYGEMIYIGDLLLEGTTWDVRELTANGDGKIMRFYDDENQTIRGYERGKGYIDINAPNGSARVNVTVKFSAWHWFKYIFLNGWFFDVVMHDNGWLAGIMTIFMLPFMLPYFFILRLQSLLFS